MPEKRLHWVEVMRGIAACWVLVHHADIAAMHFVGPGSRPAFISNGYLGVDFFFVLSGFIIAYSANRMIAQGRGWQDYANARAVRVYVPYLPIGVGMLVVYGLLPGISEAGRDPGFLTSIFLLPTDSPPALSVAWTLVHELLFYTLFSLIFVSRRLLFLSLAFWSALILLVGWFDLGYPRFLQYFLSPLNLCFVLGVLVYHASRKWTVSGREAALLAIVGAAIVVGMASQDVPGRGLIAIGFGLLILAAASEAAQRLNAVPFLLSLGAASYSIYLIHNPVISLAARIARSMPEINEHVAFVLISFASLLAGLAYYLYFERHAIVRARIAIQDRFKGRRRVLLAEESE